MIVVTNASPLIALGQAGVLPIFASLFGQVLLPEAVYQETVIGCKVPMQKQAIESGLGDFLEIVAPVFNRQFSRNLGAGEAGVLNLGNCSGPLAKQGLGRLTSEHA